MKLRMFDHRIVFFITIIFFLFSQPVFCKEIAKTALIIGNSDYKTSPLKNPVNDSRDMAKVLTDRGFHVFHLENVDRSQMRQGIREFEEALGKNKGVGLFYFAGHGIQLQGKNYLVPIGADLQKEYEVPDETILADSVLEAMDYANNELNIIILDACRNNPFPRSFRSASRGLARMDTMGSGMLIAYATSPGSIAMDGKGENGIYTKHLLEAINKPGLSIEQIFKYVRQKVMTETNRNQTPWEESSLTGDFYFIATDNARVTINQAPASKPAAGNRDNQEEVMFWQGISSSQKSSDYQTYLLKYPDGVFSELAKSRIKNLLPSSQRKNGEGKGIVDAKSVASTSPQVAGKIIGQWREIYTENNKQNYLQFAFSVDGTGSAEREEPDGSWWASPFKWDFKENMLIITYKDTTEKYRFVSIDTDAMVLVGVDGDIKGDTLSLDRVPENESRKSIEIKEDQIIGTWKETWEEDGKKSFQLFSFRGDGTFIETGQELNEKWSNEGRWKLQDNVLLNLDDENQKYRIVNATQEYLDVIDLSPEYKGVGARFFRVKN